MKSIFVQCSTLGLMSPGCFFSDSCGILTIHYLVKTFGADSVIQGSCSADCREMLRSVCLFRRNLCRFPRFTIAVHVLMCIETFKNDRKVTSDFLASSVNVNPVVIRRLLQQLKSAGIVQVVRGSGGADVA